MPPVNSDYYRIICSVVIWVVTLKWKIVCYLLVLIKRYLTNDDHRDHSVSAL